MKAGKIIIIAGSLLIAASLLLTGYNICDNQRVKKETGTILERMLPAIALDPVPEEGRAVAFAEEEVEYPDYVIAPEKEMPVESIDGLDMVGILSLQSLGIELPVCNDWNYPNLRKCPCRYVGKAYTDDFVICAHNYDRHFGRLRNLNYGDKITFTDMDGNVFTYQVTEILDLEPHAIEEMTEGDWDLTLFTCTLGGASRVTVRCERQAAPVRIP